ncbi:MAG: hypothetical protein CVV27_04380 [Candidatus Melainabacteria bacterium HGW-Melainabacteria-1]|nr:MAG: hypothetical protein CVV27_04380 [Candidatus Melainabacteria bacterium HGW-Melainabacteria-1]
MFALCPTSDGGYRKSVKWRIVWIKLSLRGKSSYFKRAEVYCALKQAEAATADFAKACELGLSSACERKCQN